MAASPTRPARLVAGARRALFVYLIALVAAVGSERMFWFWSTGLEQHLGVAAFYALAAAWLVWAIARYRVDSWWSLMLALPLFSLVTEGVITPVTYSGGPFVPVFPAWFAFWHGVLSAGLLVFGIRWMLVNGRRRMLALTSAGLGVFWGVWSTTLRLPENLEDPELIEENGTLEILDVGEFGLYAATFTAVVIAGHVLLDRVWPDRFDPSPTTVRIVGALTLLWAAAWTVVIPWALPMFVAYWWLQRWGLRRHERTASDHDLFTRLQGRVEPVAYLPLGLMGVFAAATYAVVWELEPAESFVRTTMWSIIAAQAVAGGVLMVRSLRRAGRSERQNDDTLEPVGPRVS